MTVLVTGSRGRVASTLLGLLDAAGVKARAASKNPADLSPPPGTDTVRCDLTDPDTFDTALAGVESVFLYAEASHGEAFADRARAAGVEHVVLLSSSSVLAPDAADHPIAASHLAAERALSAAADAGHFEATHLQPGAFATNALQWAPSLRDGRGPALPHPHSSGDPIHERDVAEAAFAVLTEPRLRGSSYLLTGPESLTFVEQLAVLAEATGRPAPHTVVTPEEWKRSVSAFLPEVFADALLSHWAAHEGRPAPLTRTVEELTGHPARTFATWAADHAEAFLPRP
ncbi:MULTISPECIES: NmrA family NAD(P)-binding protein [Streptomyces]|uniref:Putative hydroxylase n=3 Tax=Streptomyces venezuelae TaxID=54571 RepID=F2R8Y2_STRVP|nr:NAD(P)H-binding protein [Streptomyces venezuelae]APE22288.1 NmrA family transcriptional regulator [Streptomyces venezuelae]QER99670.1 NmrA family transcriptional regulator [Streptomyces venezuelae ATCC 10712]CCA56442.1 putative hydroxylase [Streptomyces venezuelae ATCC 10712]